MSDVVESTLDILEVLESERESVASESEEFGGGEGEGGAVR